MDLYFGLVERKINFLTCIQGMKADHKAEILQSNGVIKGWEFKGKFKRAWLEHHSGKKNPKA
jgi:hypothetical protein